jgi:hypothetical protein
VAALPKGVAGHPIIGQGGGCHPLGQSGVGEPPQSALGVVRPPPNDQKTIKQKKVRVLGGGQNHLQALGVVQPPPKGLKTKNTKKKKKKKVWVLRGGRIIPKGLGSGSSTPGSAFGGGPATPKTQTLFWFFFFFFLRFGGCVLAKNNFFKTQDNFETLAFKESNAFPFTVMD